MIKLLSATVMAASMLASAANAGDPHSGLADGFYTCGSCSGTMYGSWRGVYGPTPGTPVIGRNAGGRKIVIGWLTSPYTYYDEWVDRRIGLGRNTGLHAGYQTRGGGYIVREGQWWNGSEWSPIGSPSDNCTQSCN